MYYELKLIVKGGIVLILIFMVLLLFWFFFLMLNFFSFYILLFIGGIKDISLYFVSVVISVWLCVCSKK